MKLSVQMVLMEYDGPQVIEARSVIGGRYVGVLVDAAQSRFVLAGASPERLRKLRIGELDLRELFAPIDGGEPVIGDLSPEGIIEAEPLGSASIDYLPEPGLYVRKRSGDAAAVLIEAQQRDAFVVELSLEPPEAAVESRIRSATLSVLLLRWQNLVKHAYNRAVRNLKQSVKDTIDRDKAHELYVLVPAAAGSFKVLLGSAQPPGIGGYSEAERAFALLDTLLSSVGDPDRTLELVGEYRGHLAGAYQKFLQFVDESDLGLTCTWAQPESSKPTAWSVSRPEAHTLLAALETVANLTTESVVLIGTLQEVSVPQNRWGIESDGRRSVGRVKQGGLSLMGLTIGNRYRFECVEELETTEWGKETRILYLERLDSLSSSAPAPTEAQPALSL